MKPIIKFIQKVKTELVTHYNIKDVKFLKNYHIKKTLPKLLNLQNDIESSGAKLTDTVFFVGDLLINGLLNAAMTSGQKVALELVAELEVNKKLRNEVKNR